MQWMSEASAASFQKEVVERSARELVLVDFWAPWCQPCRVLGPLLESIVEGRAGRVWLVKVNTERERTLAMQYRIQGIPAVKAFLGGRIVDEFAGLRDRPFIETFIDRLVPSAEDRALQEAELLLKRGEPGGVEAALRAALHSPRHRDEALWLLARSQLASGAVAQCEQTLREIPKDSPIAQSATSLLGRVELLREADGVDLATRRREVEESPDDSNARWHLAGALLASGQLVEALEELLELLRRNRAYRDDGARRAMLGIIDELGPGNDLAREYRRRMQVYL